MRIFVGYKKILLGGWKYVLQQQEFTDYDKKKRIKKTREEQN